MKNNYCALSQEEIHRLPERFKGYLLSPFQFNLFFGLVHVPEEKFREMIALIAEYASLPNAQVDRAGQATPDKQSQESSRLRSNDLLGGSTIKPDTTKQENQP